MFCFFGPCAYVRTGYFCKNKMYWLSDVNPPELSKWLVLNTYVWRTSKPYLLCCFARNFQYSHSVWVMEMVVEDSSLWVGKA